MSYTVSWIQYIYSSVQSVLINENYVILLIWYQSQISHSLPNKLLCRHRFRIHRRDPLGFSPEIILSSLDSPSSRFALSFPVRFQPFSRRFVVLQLKSIINGKTYLQSKYRSAPSSSPGLASPISPLARGDSPHAQSDSPHVSGDIAPSPPPRSTYVDRFEVSNNPTNIHSPYYLYSSDHPGLVLVSEPLDGNNYGIWLIAMTTSLEAKNKIGFIDGSIPKPSENDQFFKIWCRCNSMLKSWLLNSVSKKIYTSILYIKHASDIWKDLHTRFHKSNLPRLYKLRHQIHSLRQGSLDLSSYHTQTQALWEKLTSIQPPAFTVEELLAEKETNRVIDFLMGLNDNYESIRSRILMKKVLPSLSEIYNLLD